MAIKAFSWDLDGTITNSKSVLVELIQRKLKEEMDWDVSLEMIVYYFNNGVREMIKRIGRDLEKEISNERASEVADLILKEKSEIKLPILKGVKENLIKMKELGLRLALCSNNTHGNLVSILRNGDLAEFFEVIVGDDDTPTKKPAPEMIWKVAEELGIEKDELVHVEDSSVGIKAGKNAGVKVLAVATGTQTLEELEKFEPDWLFDNLEEFDLEKFLTEINGK